jgi:hypothetical protein
MADRWADLKAWLNAERDKAGEASAKAGAALHALVDTKSPWEWSAAVKASDEANSRAQALAEVDRKMGELERQEPGHG